MELPAAGSTRRTRPPTDLPRMSSLNISRRPGPRSRQRLLGFHIRQELRRASCRLSFPVGLDHRFRVQHDMEVSDYSGGIQQGSLDLIRRPIAQPQGHSCRLQVDYCVGRGMGARHADFLPHIADRRYRAVE